MAQLVKKLPDNAGDSKDTGPMPLVRKIPCRRKWQPPPVFLPGRQEDPGGLLSMELQRVRHD